MELLEEFYEFTNEAFQRTSLLQGSQSLVNWSLPSNQRILTTQLLDIMDQEHSLPWHLDSANQLENLNRSEMQTASSPGTSKQLDLLFRDHIPSASIAVHSHCSALNLTHNSMLWLPSPIFPLLFMPSLPINFL